MYKVLCDGYTLHDPSLNDVNYMLIDPVLTEEVNKAASFTFSIPKTHANANALQRLKSVIEIFSDSRRIFRGRILEDTRDWDDTRNVVCESDLAFLNDTVKRPFETQNLSAAAYFRWLITYHNNLAPDDKKFQYRDVTVSGSVTIPENAGYPTIWSELENNLLNQFDGYLFVTYDDQTGKNIIDYLADSPYHSTQKITFGENLLDISREARGGEIITRLIPLGAKNASTGKPLTIKSVNNNEDFIVNSTAETAYGRIWGVEIWDNVTSAQELLTKGQRSLALRSQGITSTQLTAVDLHLLDTNIESFDFMSYVTVEDPAHDISGEMLITRKTTNLTDPSRGTITIGEESRGISKFYAGTTAQIAQIVATYTTEEEIRTIETTISSEIQQQDNKISMVVSESGGGYVIRAAEIVESINEAGSSVKVSADHITLTGEVVVNAINGGSTTINGAKITTGTINGDRLIAGTVNGDRIIAGTLEADRITVKDTNNNTIFSADSSTKNVQIGGFSVAKNSIKYTSSNIDKVEISNTVIASRDRYSAVIMENGGVSGETDGDPTWSGVEGAFSLNAGTGLTIWDFNNGEIIGNSDLSSRHVTVNHPNGGGGVYSFDPRVEIYGATNTYRTTMYPTGIEFREDPAIAAPKLSVIRRLRTTAGTTSITLDNGVYLAVVTHQNNGTASQSGLAIIQIYNTSSVLNVATAGGSTLEIASGDAHTLNWITTNTYRELFLIKLTT